MDRRRDWQVQVKERPVRSIRGLVVLRAAAMCSRRERAGRDQRVPLESSYQSDGVLFRQLQGALQDPERQLIC